LFDALFAVLNGEVSAAIADPAPTGAARENFAFFEASGRSFDPTAAPGRDGAAG
jgi:hypothetical protein